MSKFIGNTYEEINKSVQDFVENPGMIALPGGSWCYFCHEELCRDSRHRRTQLLLITINKLVIELKEARHD